MWAARWQVGARNAGIYFVSVDHVWTRRSMKNLLYAMLKGYVLMTIQQRASNNLLYGMSKGYILPTSQRRALEGGELGQSP